MPIAVGIDIGNHNITVAVVRRKGVDIVVNDVSNRQTPAYVSFGEKERAIGEAGFSLYLRNVKNTIVNVKRIIGREYDSDDVKTELKELPYQTVKLDDGMIGMKVMYHGEEQVFRAEHIIAMLLVQIKSFTETYTQDHFTDCVLSVPGYFTENQRRAMLDAAQIAGVSCLRLLNEHTATALAYGFYKTDLSTTEPRPVLIIDVGHSNTTASLINLYKGKMKVVGVEYDWSLGGRNYDQVVAEYVRQDIITKWKYDIKTNPRAWRRVVGAVEKSVKRVISSGSPLAILNLDTLYEERDYSFKFTKELYDDLTKDLNNKVVGLVQALLDKTNITIEKVHSIELTGSGTRLSTLQACLENAFKKQLSKTINCEESIARGCALACAQLQPYFKVTDYVVEDLPPYELTVEYATDSKTIQPMRLIGKDASFPVTKILKFKNAKKLHLGIDYNKNSKLFPGSLGKGVELDIPEVPKAKTETPELKVRIALNHSGVLELVDAVLTETVEEEFEVEKTIEVPEEVVEEKKEMEEEKPVEKPMEEEKPVEDKTPQSPAADDKKMEEDNKKESPVPEEKKDEKKEEKKPKMVKKVIKEKQKKMVNKEYNCKTFFKTTGLRRDQHTVLLDREAQLQASDKLYIDTAHAKNDLESYVYSMKDKLFGELAEFTTEDEAMKCSAELEKFVDWLYEDGEDETKGVYISKKKEAEGVVKHIVAKKEERDRKIAEEKRRKEEEERKKREEEERKKKEEEEKKKKAEEEAKKAEEEKKKAEEEAKKKDENESKMEEAKDDKEKKSEDGVMEEETKPQPPEIPN